MVKTTTPTTSAEHFLVSINLRSMKVYDEEGRDVRLRVIDGHDPEIQENCILVDGRLHKIQDFELYCEVLSFYATPIDGGARHE